MNLTKNFTRKEFDSKDGSVMSDSVLVNITKLACSLQRLRDRLGVPISINSGYRSPQHNKRVGGVANSQHVTGMAADIVAKGVSPKKVAEAIEQLILSGDMLQGGVGIYDTFTHYDIRGKRTRW